MTARFQAPRGTYDLVPPRSEVFLAVVDGLSAPARRSGYGYVQTPTFEDTALFVRGVGESSDVVSKEMYTFTDKGGRSLSLRPEGTAGVLRAVVEHGLHRGQLPLKLWYTGPNFRYEAPQSGRYRQHTQVGIEAIGVDDPLLDAEVVWIAWAGYRGLGLQDFSLLLNSLGCRECRPAYRALLQDFLRGLDLDEETRRRAESNPLRVLDDKRPEMQEKLAGAPLMADHLCAACKEYHDAVRTTLADLGVAWTDAPRLVRGLDYYTRTTFEIQHNRLGAQAAVGGGGRYDGLLATLGGPDLGGIGFGLGVDRTMLALDEEGVALPLPRSCDVYAVPLGDAARRLLIGLVTELRDAGIAADFAYGDRGLKRAMRAADRSGARFALLLGDRDLAESSVQLKDLRTGEQQAIAIDDVLDTIKQRLS